MAKVTAIALPRPTLCSILNWDATLENDPKILARYARQASTLANLVVAGLKVEADEVGSGNDFEAELGRQCTAITEVLCFKLAKQLGALEDE